jgi:hypothetical protein
VTGFFYAVVSVIEWGRVSERSPLASEGRFVS